MRITQGVIAAWRLQCSVGGHVRLTNKLSLGACSTAAGAADVHLQYLTGVRSCKHIVLR